MFQSSQMTSFEQKSLSKLFGSSVMCLWIQSIATAGRPFPVYERKLSAPKILRLQLSNEVWVWKVNHLFCLSLRFLYFCYSSNILAYIFFFNLTAVAPFNFMYIPTYNEKLWDTTTFSVCQYINKESIAFISIYKMCKGWAVQHSYIWFPKF